MSVLLSGDQLRTISLGTRVEKSTGTLAASTVPLFTIAGGRILLTTCYGLVTTAITVANSYKLQFNPTTGDTSDLCAATDIGTTDTAAGSTLQFGLSTTTAPAKLMSIGTGTARLDSAIGIGQIESVSAGTDGVILWVVTWIPLDTGATLVAA
jgi:hypothetical protein